MDPLSVSMAIVGLLNAAQHISSTIGNLVSKSKSAPKEIQNIKSTVDTIRAVLLQLQMLILGRTKVDRQRSSLVLVDQVVITLSACVATFSEVDVLIRALDSDDRLGLMDRIRWATRTTTIQEHLHKLEMHKSSLTLIMTILTCGSIFKAEDAVDELSGVIQQVLDNHQILAQRLLSIEIGMNAQQTLISHPSNAGEYIPEIIQRTVGDFAFEEVLQDSWVYKRSDRRGDNTAFSIISSAGRTASWSILSGLSLSDNMSIIAVQALPVYAHDISNSAVYHFGEFDNSAIGLKPEADAHSLPGTPNPDRTFQESLRGLAAVTITKDTSRTSVNLKIPSDTSSRGVFGIPLKDSINYANVAISLVDAQGKSYIYGYVPIVVAKIGVFLKEKGTVSEAIFGQSGSAERINDLEIIFNTAKHNYGKGLDWETGFIGNSEADKHKIGYKVYDAASCLLRFLKLLPEPVIPFDFYDQFTAAMEKESAPGVSSTEMEGSFDPSNLIATLQVLVTSLPPLNRQLLLYLLNLLSVFASKSKENHMTSRRLVAAFQPALLSRPPSMMSASDYELASDTMVFMIHKQDKLLIRKRGTAADSDTNMDGLAPSILRQNNYAEATAIYRQALQLREIALGKQHPDTLISMNNLANSLYSHGKHVEAEIMYQQTLQLRKTVLGKEHPATLRTMNGLANSLHDQGKYSEAETIYQQTLQIQDAVLGKEHPDTLWNMYCLANSLYSHGKHVEAEIMYRQTLQLRETVLGKEHPATLRTMNGLANSLHDQGKYSEAEAIYRQTLQIQDAVLGKENPDTLWNMHCLANSLYSQGKHVEAESMYRQTLQLRETVLGKEHPATLRTMDSLANVLMARARM